MEQVGSGFTVSTMSSVSVHRFDCTTVRRSVAVAEETCAVVTRDSGDSMMAKPDTTLQVVVAIGAKPEVAMPWSGNAVESPSVQRAWSAPALALGPIVNW